MAFIDLTDTADISDVSTDSDIENYTNSNKHRLNTEVVRNTISPKKFKCLRLSSYSKHDNQEDTSSIGTLSLQLSHDSSSIKSIGEASEIKSRHTSIIHETLVADNVATTDSYVATTDSNVATTDSNSIVQEWAHAYMPHTTKDLALHHQKIRDMRNWLHQHIGRRSPRILMLVGPSGSGKSTAVRVLCEELSANIQEWTDESGRYTGFKPSEVSFETTSRDSDFARFLTSASSFPSLQNKDGSADTALTQRVLLVEDIVGNIDSTDRIAASARDHVVRKAVLDYLRVGMVPLIFVISSCPASLRALDETDTQPTRRNLVRWWGQDIMSHPAVDVIEVRPVAPTKLKKALNRIVNLVKNIHDPHDQNTLVRGKKQRKSKTLKTNNSVPSDLLDWIISHSRGDIRHAIASLQFWYPRQNADAARAISSRTRTRDEFYNSMHSLGKLLYAKRNEEGNLQFDPDRIAANCTYDADTLSSFLHQNLPDFYTSIEDMKPTLDTLCLSDILLASKWRSGYSGGISTSMRGEMETADTPHTDNVSYHGAVFPEAYATCLSARSVATYNTKPAAAGFRPLTKPKLYTVQTIRRRNQGWVLRGRLGSGYGVDPTHVMIGTSLQRNSSVPMFDAIMLDSPLQRILWKIPYMSVLARLARNGQTHEIQNHEAKCFAPAEAALVDAACQYTDVDHKSTLQTNVLDAWEDWSNRHGVDPFDDKNSYPLWLLSQWTVNEKDEEEEEIEDAEFYF